MPYNQEALDKIEKGLFEQNPDYSFKGDTLYTEDKMADENEKGTQKSKSMNWKWKVLIGVFIVLVLVSITLFVLGSGFWVQVVGIKYRSKYDDILQECLDHVPTKSTKPGHTGIYTIKLPYYDNITKSIKVDLGQTLESHLEQVVSKEKIKESFDYAITYMAINTIKNTPVIGKLFNITKVNLRLKGF